MTIRLSELNNLWGNPGHGNSLDFDIPLGRVCNDTRRMSEGDFFVPLVGNNFDGHAFLNQAANIGAQGVVVSNESSFSIPEDLLYWTVEDTTTAYLQLGLLMRKEIGIPVVAITGSTGKTTTRELIRSLLSPMGEVLCTSDNINNQIGVPMTLLQGTRMHRVAILEMGMRGLGEIEQLSSFTEPDIAVITNIGTAHIGLLGSRDAIAQAK